MNRLLKRTLRLNLAKAFVQGVTLRSDWEMIRTRIFQGIFRRPLVGLSCLLILGVIGGSLIVMQTQRASESRAWVEHTHAVILQINTLKQDLYAAESSARGYVLTGAPVQRETFNDIAGPNGSLARQLDALQELVKDNPKQEDNLQAVRGFIADKVAYMRSSLDLIESLGIAAAQERIKNGQGIARMNAAMTAIAAMAAIEDELLAQRTTQDKMAEQIAMSIGIASSLLLLLVVLLAYVAIRREFNRRMSVERALLESEQLKRNVINNSFYPIISINLQGIVQTFNAAAERMLGYTADEVIGIATPHLWHEQFEINERRQAISQELNTNLAGDHDVYVTKPELEGSEEREWVYVRKDGTKLDVLLSITPLRDADGNITGFMGIGKDITERKQVERLKNEFISTVSHELRTPLTSIRGSLGLVVGNVVGALPEKASQLIHIAYKNTERLVQLINNILDIERLEAGRMAMVKKPISVAAIMQQATEVSDGLAATRHITLVSDDNAGEAMALGDPDRLLQVLTNFISNAIKFAPAGSAVTLRSALQEGMVRFTVEDNGPGIPADFRDRVFSRFAQADNIAPQQKSGSGLGLSISKAIAEEMDGLIGFDSVPGHTEFHLILPASHASDELTELPIVVRNKRILICEDEPDIAALLRMNLETEGYACTVVGSASDAKAALASGDFAAMTLDLCLPDQDGMALLDDLRQNASTADLPIVIITAVAKTESALDGRAVAFADWLTKPIDLKRLNRVMHNIVCDSPVARILHIEDDADIVEFLAASLEGIATFTRAGTAAQARALLGQDGYDLALLDIYLPDGNGLDLLPILSNQNPPVPVIILSVSETSNEVKDKVLASLVKSVVSEDKIVATVKAYIERRG